jgi:hypothetical protein
VVTSPPELTTTGIAYFDAKDDIKTAEGLVKEIESFLRE